MNPSSPAFAGLFALATAAALPAQQFRTNLTLGIAPGEGIVYAGDLDGDGDAELVLGAQYMTGTQVLTNLGNGRFLRQPPSPTVLQPTPQDWARGDIDGDGDLDLLGYMPGSGLLLLRNDGTRLVDVTANLHVTHGTPARPLLFVDADGDGDRDLVAITPGLYSHLLLNDGQGVFTDVWPNNLPVSMQGVTALLARDLDGDGREDLIVGNLIATQLWMQRPGGFVDESAARLPVVPGFPVHVAALDHDGDGDVDLALATDQDQLRTSTVLLENQGNGVFTDVTAQRMPLFTASVTRAFPCDFDADGDQDLIYQVAGQAQLLLRNLHGQGFAVDTTAWQGDLVSTDTPWSAVDFDGDRYPDLLTAQALLRNQGGRSLQCVSRNPSIDAIVFADVEGDGDADALATSGIWRNQGGRFQRDTSAAVGRATAVGDLDGDGDVDVVTRGTSGIESRHNDGQGHFTVSAILPGTLTLTNGLALGDVDGDGDLDLATAEGLGIAPLMQQNRLYRNDGTGRFTDVTATHLPAWLGGCTTVRFGDADADGDLDLVYAVFALQPATLRPTLRLYLNQGNGMFVDGTSLVPSTSLVLSSTGKVSFAQIDGDPEPELLQIFGNALHVYDRAGAGWQEVTASRLPASVTTVYVATAMDFDEDGDVDLLLTGSSNMVLANDGTGTFTDVTASRGAGLVAAGLAVDVDGDGDPDMLTGVNLMLNMQRQLTLPLPPRTGHTSTLEYVAEPGFGADSHLALIGLSLDRQLHPATSPLGTFFLGGGVLHAAVLSNQGATGTASLTVPANPALTGLRLYLQGIDLTLPSGAVHLTNFIATAIE